MKIKDVVLDTDPFNEVDDQFAIAYLLAASGQVNIKAFYAAPFFNDTVASPADGMQRSYDEILHILRLTGRADDYGVYRGSAAYLPNDVTPVDSDAARHLVELGKNYSPENRLCVIAIAALTDIASALLIDPSLEDKLEIVWLGSNATGFWSNWEFNLQQDIAASRAVMKSCVPVTVLPCGGVVSHLITTKPELRFWLGGKNAVCEYLVETTEKFMARCGDNYPWSRVIWDVAAIARVLDRGEKFMRSKTIKAPVFTDDLGVSYPTDGKDINYVYEIFRDEIFRDMIEKLIGII